MYIFILKIYQNEYIHIYESILYDIYFGQNIISKSLLILKLFKIIINSYYYLMYGIWL